MLRSVRGGVAADWDGESTRIGWDCRVVLDYRSLHSGVLELICRAERVAGGLAIDKGAVVVIHLGLVTTLASRLSVLCCPSSAVRPLLSVLCCPSSSAVEG